MGFGATRSCKNQLAPDRKFEVDLQGKDRGFQGFHAIAWVPYKVSRLNLDLAAGLSGNWL